MWGLRPRAPRGGSILMTSAPRSARIMSPKVPAITWPSSRARMWERAVMLPSPPSPLSRARERGSRSALDEKDLLGLLDALAALIEDAQLAADDAAIRPGGLAAIEDLDPRSDGVAGPDRRDELELIEPEEGDQGVVVQVELEEQPGRDSVNQRPVRHAGAE